MKVTLSKTQGYCAGVNYAINTALNARNKYKDEPIYILGMLVHNETVINLLNELNITTLIGDDQIKLLYDLADKSILIFPAHGHKKELEDIASKKQFRLIDATCPIVNKNLNIIKDELNNNHQIIYIGHKNHPEALAALSLDNNVIFYDVKTEFDYRLVKDKSPLVINQTTLNIEELKEIYLDIIVHKPRARIMDEICNSTRIRQLELKDIPLDIDLILIVGDKKSSNTNRLLEIAKLYHPNIDSYLVSNLKEIKNIDLFKYKHVYISSGASTPKIIIDDISNYLLNN